MTRRAVDDATERTFDAFGYEWTRFGTIQPEDEKFWRGYYRDVPLPELAGRPALDAGCGMGRFTRFLAEHVGHVVALDGSDAVVSAAKNLADLPNAAVVKADLRRAPFPPRSFEFVACLGVLHHLSDPEAGFRALVELLRPGGRVLVYLYSRPQRFGVRAAGLAASRFLRRITVRLPHSVVRVLSAAIAALLYAGVVLPGRVITSLPLATYRRRPVRSLWLDTFDRLSAPVEYRYVKKEVEGLFSRAGLVIDAARDEAGWFVTAHKPAS
ncbi:MAG: class I SAM-dependent methyltransferase [Actinomycetota bacterium]